MSARLAIKPLTYCALLKLSVVKTFSQSISVSPNSYELTKVPISLTECFHQTLKSLLQGKSLMVAGRRAYFSCCKVQER